MKQQIIFDKDEDQKHIDFESIVDNEWDLDKVFFVKISLDLNDTNSSQCIILKNAVQTVTRTNNDGNAIYTSNLHIISLFQ